ncbi:MAG: response regulator [Spirulina sp. SIO3F2]|nr:response regulator [Spirulina sp. SIO3F2]
MSPKLLILVVDDNPLNVDVLEELLEDAGFAVASAFSGDDAIALAKGEHPSLVLLDVMMPGMDGLETCKAFKADPDLNSIPIILITALDDRSITKQSRKVGAVGYITKPFEEEAVLACIQKYLGS